MDAAEEIRYLLLAIQREGNRQFADALRPLNLTPSQAEVIRVLSETGPISLIGLGERLVCENGSPSRLVKRMVQAGLIVKQPAPDDGRAVVLSLTEASRALLPHLAVIEAALHNQIDETLNVSGIPTESILAALWRFADDTEAGDALKRRKAKL